jgi:hypothetical protein
MFQKAADAARDRSLVRLISIPNLTACVSFRRSFATTGSLHLTPSTHTSAPVGELENATS